MSGSQTERRPMRRGRAAMIARVRAVKVGKMMEVCDAG